MSSSFCKHLMYRSFIISRLKSHLDFYQHIQPSVRFRQIPSSSQKRTERFGLRPCFISLFSVRVSCSTGSGGSAQTEEEIGGLGLGGLGLGRLESIILVRHSQGSRGRKFKSCLLLGCRTRRMYAMLHSDQIRLIRYQESMKKPFLRSRKG